MLSYCPYYMFSEQMVSVVLKCRRITNHARTRAYLVFASSHECILVTMLPTELNNCFLNLLRRKIPRNSEENSDAEVSFATIPWRKTIQLLTLIIFIDRASIYTLTLNASSRGSFRVSAKVGLVIRYIKKCYPPQK